ncbi:hypothetical protein IEO21_07690 [Rhodonia placenta]|uniref:BTB domain-containing protein n=1 Tax=Rhodonia placenta TaxID=104341 RepID=A0A8H7NXQ0_9APHY|nr:hypothetical protein IEO21_07690 [Postia placenta]
MALDMDFSSNRHAATVHEYEVPTRHPELSFEDGNLAIVTGRQYFLVHRGLLCRHSSVLGQSISSLGSTHDRLLEGRSIMTLQDTPEDMVCFLQALYGFHTNLENKDFRTISALLRTSTKYGVDELRKEAIRVLSLSWPTSLSQWEKREKNVTDIHGLYSPRLGLPHPTLIIELAREVNAPDLLPSAFYDLSRYPPSQIALGHISEIDSRNLNLASEDLLRVLRGKEQSARFLSTFIVNELEGREPSDGCLRRQDPHSSIQRACQVAFETINFELIRDVNSMVCNRNSDPLFAIADSLLMQTREDVPGAQNRAVYRACEVCRLEYGSVVDTSREDFWRRIPEWFELELWVSPLALRKQLILLSGSYDEDRTDILLDTDDLMQDEFLDFEDFEMEHGMISSISPTTKSVYPEPIQLDYGFTRFSADPQSGTEEFEPDSNLEDSDLREQVIEGLEGFVLSLLEQLSDAISASDDKRSKNKRIRIELANRKKTVEDGSFAVRTLRFPQKARGASIVPFAQLFKIVDHMHEALLHGVPTTKRDIYYKDVRLFKSQAVVDRLVDDVAATLDVGRADLFVRASSKGLIAACGLTMHLKEGMLELNDAEVISTHPDA